MERTTSDPLTGAASFRVPNNATGYGKLMTSLEDAVYITASVRFASIPSSARIVRIVNESSGTSVTAGNLKVSGGMLVLQSGSTPIGTGVPLTAGTVYRIGLHQQRGTGSDGVLAAYLAEGDAPFGAPFAQSSTESFSTPVKRIEVGATNSVTLDATFDDIIVDTAAFAAP